MLSRLVFFSMINLWPLSASAAAIAVEAGQLAAALALAAPGDELRLLPGLHPGPVRIAVQVTLTAEAGAVIDGDGRGSSVSVTAPGVVLRGLEIRNSGTSLFEQDSGIFLDKTATGAVIEENRVIGNLIGIYAWGAKDVVIRNNRIVGRTDLRLSERGNGIQLWNAPGTKVIDNRIENGRDGIFVTTSHHNLFHRNQFRQLRFAVHYMYTNDSEVSENVSDGNHVGYAIMFSQRLTVRDNISRQDRLHGLLLNYTNNSKIERNIIDGRFTQNSTENGEETVRDADMPPDDIGLSEARSGTGKCIFIYNTNKNQLRGNRFSGCEIGVHFTAGSERNIIVGNAFIANRTQVKYVGTRALEWSENGRGNFWSDNAAFDVNGDGIADEAYRPNDIVDRILWAHPQAKLLLNSPAVQTIRWAQKQFPALHPGGVVDSAPLMVDPVSALAQGVR